MRRPFGELLVAGLVALAACSDSRQAASPPSAAGSATTSSATSAPATSSATTTPTTVATTPSSTTDRGPQTSTTTTTRPRGSTTTTTRPRSTTTEPDKPDKPDKPRPLPGVENPECVVEIKRGDSLSAIADGVDDRRVDIESLQLENGLADPDAIRAGDYLDVCINKVDDITGDKRVPKKPTPPPPTSPEPPGGGSGVMAQQERLNALLAGVGFPALAVDGDSGAYTEQALCTARMALKLPVNRADMASGSPEEQALMAAGGLSMPAAAPTWAGRWALVDRTCQVMFVGSGSEIVFVFPVSTGEAGHETRLQDGSGVFRYDPATENGGWHDSTTYPVEVDDPLNGNMYKPLYFDGGQAIHGAGNVPTYPASKGCVRMQVGSQDMLVGWLGLQDVSSALWDGSNIGMVVSVVGDY